MTDFERCMRFVAEREGGKVDDPVDPGGRTNMGVTQRTYDAWRRAAHLEPRDVYLLTEDERDAIFLERYWRAAHCQDLAWPLCLAVFDAAINCGVSRALRWLEADATFDAVNARRREHYRTIIAKNPSLLKYKNGWENRVALLEKEAA